MNEKILNIALIVLGIIIFLGLILFGKGEEYPIVITGGVLLIIAISSFLISTGIINYTRFTVWIKAIIIVILTFILIVMEIMSGFFVQ